MVYGLFLTLYLQNVVLNAMSCTHAVSLSNAYSVKEECLAPWEWCYSFKFYLRSLLFHDILQFYGIFLCST